MSESQCGRCFEYKKDVRFVKEFDKQLCDKCVGELDRLDWREMLGEEQ